MHREGADPFNMQPEDFLCDFCGLPWSEDRPFVEGHRGSCICGKCLTVAYSALVHLNAGEPLGEGGACTLCLEPKRDQPHWRSPALPEKLACIRCVKQSAGVLHKDPEADWEKPKPPTRSA